MTEVTAHVARTAMRRLLVLLLVAVLAVPVVAAANRLRVHVDGERIDVLSWAGTVSDLLAEEGVELAAGDTVLPAPSTPRDEVSTITVLRTIEVELVVDGEATTHRGTFRTVDGLLADAGVELAADQLLRPGPRTPLADGDVVTITSATPVTILDGDGTERTVTTHLDTVGELLDSLAIALEPGQDVRPRRGQPLPDTGRVTIEAPVTVTITADGETRTLTSFTETVAELLDEAGVRVGRRDRLTPGRSSVLADGTEVVVQRVTVDELVEEVAIPFAEVRESTSSLYEGDTRVVTAGVDGRQAQTYEVTYVDGVEESRELVAEEVLTEPVTQVVEVGTKERPPPPPPPSGDSIWYELARCESGLRWDYNGSSGFDGGLQFHPSTWLAYRPAGYPDYAYQATAGQQIAVGKLVQARQGWGAWPSCARKLGLI